MLGSPDSNNSRVCTVTTNRAHVLLWTDNTASYLDAIKAAGLADRVLVESVPRKGKPSAEQLARTEALMAPGVPPGQIGRAHV